MSTEYLQSIAAFLEQKENFKYALEISSALELAKTRLRMKFWNHLIKQCEAFLSTEEGTAWSMAPSSITASRDGLFLLELVPKGIEKTQANYLKYAWEQNSGYAICFGIEYSKERFAGNKEDRFKSIPAIMSLDKEVRELLQLGAGNTWWLGYTRQLANFQVPADLVKLSDNYEELATSIFEPFVQVHSKHHSRIEEANVQLAGLLA